MTHELLYEIKDLEKELTRLSEKNTDLERELRECEDRVEELEKEAEESEIIYTEDQEYISKMKHCDNCRYGCKNRIHAIYCASWQLGA